MASNPQHEPTMEEILASIRKIISEDSNEAQPAAEAPRPAPAAAPAAVADNDVLELTQEVDEPAPPTPPPAPRSIPVVAAAPPKPENDVVFETIEEPVQAPEPQADAHSDIFSDRTRRAVEDTFANIEPEEREPARYEAGPMPGVDGRTVEAVFERAVRDSFAPVLTEYLHGNSEEIIGRMKPLIREWMDEHFPALLEGAVRNEVARAVKARGRR